MIATTARPVGVAVSTPSLKWQFRLDRYVPFVYWLTVVVLSWSRSTPTRSQVVITVGLVAPAPSRLPLMPRSAIINTPHCTYHRISVQVTPRPC